MTTFHALLWFWMLLGSVALLVISYMLLLRRLADTIQSKRLEMADIGRSILLSDLPEDDKRTVSFMLKNAFNGWPAFALIVYVPFHVVRLVWLKAIRHRSLVNAAPSAECAKVANLFMFSTLAANPIAAVIMLFEILTFGLVGFIVGGHVLLLRAIFAAQRAEASESLFRRRDRAAA